MDDVKHVILRLQDQKLRDEQIMENRSDAEVNVLEGGGELFQTSTTAMCFTASPVGDEEEEIVHNARQQLTTSRPPAADSHVTRSKMFSQELKDTCHDSSSPAAAAAAIKLPLQTISDRMNWCDGGGVDYHLIRSTPETHAPTGEVLSTVGMQLNAPETDWFHGASDSSKLGDRGSVVITDNMADVSELADEESAVEGDENIATKTPVPLWHCCSSPASICRYRGNCHHMTGSGSGSGDDDKEVCAAFSSSFGIAQSRGRFARQLVTCRLSWRPVSVTSCRSLCRPSLVIASKSARWSQQVQRPSLDFNKMQKTSLSGRMRRKYRRRHMRRQLRGVNLIHPSTSRRLQQHSTISSNAVVVGCSKPSHHQKQLSQCHVSDSPIATSVRTVGDLDPAVFRFRSIWFAASGSHID